MPKTYNLNMFFCLNGVVQASTWSRRQKNTIYTLYIF